MVIVRLCLILSHGNARVESGFSINENQLQVNVKESSIVLQHLAYEGIYWRGGVVEVKVTPELQKCAGALTIPTKQLVKKLDKKKAKQGKTGQKKGKSLSNLMMLLWRTGFGF